MIVAWVLPVLGVQLVILLANLWHWKQRKVADLTQGSEPLPELSVLIPVRNERARLPNLLQRLRELQPTPLEVILCDDGSDDGSTEWLREQLPLHQPGERFSWFPAPPKPEGWVGKNWACHQLGMRARGQWLLFLDADLTLYDHSLRALRNVLAHCGSSELVTAVPALQPSGFLVGLLKLMVPYSVFTLLPLRLAERHPHPAFAFANGQVIAFPRCLYQQRQPHLQVRDAVLEDVQLARLVKSSGGTVRILDGRRQFRVRMYDTLAEATAGFSKNAVAICGGVPGAVAVAIALVTVYLLPLGEAVLGGIEWWHGLHYLLGAFLFGASGWMAGLPWWYGIFHPCSILIGEVVLWRSIVWYRRGEVRWKGRVYPVR
jgi:hypothetical protein